MSAITTTLSRKDQKLTLQTIAIAISLTGFSYLVAWLAGWVTEINWLEVFAVATSYACTWLCVKQRRFNYVLAIFTTAAYCVLFYQWGLFASMATQIYLIPTVIIGWFWWGRDDKTRPVTHTGWKWWAGITLAAAVIYAGAVALSSAFGGTMAFWDSLILVGTIAAQFLMDRKKLENWIVWAVVNVVAIVLYFNSGLYLAALQYIFFLANAVYAYFEWRKTLAPSERNTTNHSDGWVPLFNDGRL